MVSVRVAPLALITTSRVAPSLAVLLPLVESDASAVTATPLETVCGATVVTVVGGAAATPTKANPARRIAGHA